MAGIYLHIPFCKQACHYCDFHFSTSLAKKDELLAAMRQEIALQKNYLGTQNIETIYFGGGTPSILSAADLTTLLDEIIAFFPVSASAEITLEANPDDLNAQKLREIKQTAVNRLSIGIQSFYQADLKWMNRAHNAEEAESAVKRAQDSGLENISIDLIYGYPLLTDEKWANTLVKVIELEVPHISSYAMTVEPRTALASFIHKGKQPAMDENQSAEQFICLMNELGQSGFDHYEISNFARPGMYSRHNTNYWKGVSYLGVGPSAHSFNGEIRQWNVANNMHYLEALQRKRIPAEQEVLTLQNQINEYLMISLRTSLGIDFNVFETRFGGAALAAIKSELIRFENKGWIQQEANRVSLTRDGKLFADHIAAELFIEEIKD